MNILLSSYDFDEPWGQPILKDVLNSDMRVTVIPFSFEKEITTFQEFDRLFYEGGPHYEGFSRAFHFYGIDDITIVDYFRDSYEIMKKKVEQADVLFLTGGFPDLFLERLDKTGLSDVIRQGHPIVIGASAGAMVQLTYYHVTPDDDYPEYIYLNGLGLVDGFEVEVHYCHSDIQNKGIERVIKERGLPVYTIANDGGLLVDGNKRMPFGNAQLVYKGR